MPPSNVCWGIEVGAGAIKALKLEADGDDLNVLDYAIVPHPKVLSTPELDQDDAIRVALGTLSAQTDLSGAMIAISVPGHQSFARFAKLPPVEPKKVPDIVKFEAQQQVPFPLEDVEWDYQTFVSPDSPEVEVGIFAVTRQKVMERLTTLGDVGMTPDVVTLSPVAAYNALAYDLGFTETTPGTVILDIGTTASDLVIADAGRVWVRTFPIGGHQFTEALVGAFQLTYSKAEKLKREAETSKHARHVFQAMRPVFSDLAQEVQRSIGFYQSTHPDVDLKRLIGLGSTFRLPGLRKYIKQQIQMDVYRIDQFKRLGIEGPKGGEFQAQSLTLATAYGLALQGLDRASLRANLMPVPVIRAAMWKRKTPWFATAAGVAAMAGASMFIRPLLDSTAVQGATQPAIISSALSEARRERSAAEDSGVLEAAREDHRAAKLVALFDGREAYTNVVSEVGSMLADAQSKAGDEIPPGSTAFSVESMETTFLPAADSNDRRGGRGGFQDDAQDDPYASRDRIRVDMVLTTPHPDARDFVITSIEEWFAERAASGYAGYEIAFDNESVEIETIDAGFSGAGGGAMNRPGGRAPRPRARGNVPGMDTGTRGGSDPNQVAPITAPEDDVRDRARVRLQWFMLLDPPPAVQDASSEGGDD